MAVPLEDSNCALIGSDEDKQARHESALTEEAWQVAGKEAGVQVWRVEQFKVVPWSQHNEKGIHLFTGDSYIVLETIQVEDAMDYSIYFWLGNKTSIDERGVAAYKSVELDAYLDGTASQSREVQGKESEDFKNMFPKLTYMQGGTGTGFRAHEMEATFISRLFQVRKIGNNIVSVQVKRERESLNQGDSFVLDTEVKIYVWHGEEAAGAEKYTATTVADHIAGDRQDGSAKVTYEIDGDFWEQLGGEGDIKPAELGSDIIRKATYGAGVLLKLTDEDGALKTVKVARGKLNNSMLDSSAVMLLDMMTEICVWIGKGASPAEKRSAFVAALEYLKMNNRDADTAVHLFKEGKKIKHAVWIDTFAE